MCVCIYISPIPQHSPTFLAQGTGFVEDNFSTPGGGEGMVQVEMRAVESDREQPMKICSLPATQLLLCSPVPNRPWTGTGLCPGHWGPLPYLI